MSYDRGYALWVAAGNGCVGRSTGCVCSRFDALPCAPCRLGETSADDYSFMTASDCDYCDGCPDPDGCPGCGGFALELECDGSGEAAAEDAPPPAPLAPPSDCAFCGRYAPCGICERCHVRLSDERTSGAYRWTGDGR